MATSGSNSVAVTNYDTLKISWSLDSQSTANNTSTITFKAQLVAGSAGKISSTASKSYTATVAGTSYSGTNTVGISNNATLTLWSKTLTLSHGSDGSLSTTFSFSQTFDITFSGSKVGTYSVSCTVNPTSIARASSITSASAVTLGNNCSVTWTPATSSYAYKLRFVIGSGSVTTDYITPGTTSAYTYTGYNFAIASWARYITSATSATCTVTLYTYTSSSSSSSLGSASKTFTVSVPSSVVPTVSIGSVAEGNSAVGIGVYVQNMSTVKVTFTGTMAYESALKSYTVTIGSLSYSGSSITSGTALTITSGALSDSGTVTIKATVTDARGRSGSASQTITVYAYSMPAITTFNAQRVDSSGTQNDNGEYVQITYNYSVSTLDGKNTCSMSIKYKSSTESSYADTITTSTELSGSATLTPRTVFSDQQGWDFQITVTDIFNTATAFSSVGTGIVPLSIYWNGTGVAIGKVADTGALFDVGLKQKIKAPSSQLSIYNDGSVSGSESVIIRCSSPSGYEVQFGVGETGVTRGIYDQTAHAWQIYSNAYNDVSVANSANFSSCNIGNTAIPLQLRGSAISINGTIDTNIVCNGNIRSETSNGSCSLASGSSYCGLYSGTRGNFVAYVSNSSMNTILGYAGSDTRLYGDNVYLAGTSTAVTSDRKLKSDIKQLDKIEDELLDQLTPHSYIVNAQPGETHFGFVVDELETAMKAAGMDPDDYGLTEHFTDEESGEDVGAIRYDEFIPLLLYKIQQLETEVAGLKSDN